MLKWSPLGLKRQLLVCFPNIQPTTWNNSKVLDLKIVKLHLLWKALLQASHGRTV